MGHSGGVARDRGGETRSTVGRVTEERHKKNSEISSIKHLRSGKAKPEQGV